ncbi:hypothetical protein ACLKA6_012953 [Drosophila palustris]
MFLSSFVTHAFNILYPGNLLPFLCSNALATSSKQHATSLKLFSCWGHGPAPETTTESGMETEMEMETEPRSCPLKDIMEMMSAGACWPLLSRSARQRPIDQCVVIASN